MSFLFYVRMMVSSCAIILCFSVVLYQHDDLSSQRRKRDDLHSNDMVTGTVMCSSLHGDISQLAYI